MNTSSTQSVTLQTAIILQVKEFAKINRTFSVHDITTALRNKTGNGELEIPEVEVTGESFRFNIQHSKVKSLFDELYQNSAFTPDFTLNRQYTGLYFEYIPSAVTVSTATNVAVPTASVPTVAVVTPTVKLDNTQAVNRISNYLTNCQNKRFNPTLKQIQSAIKRNDGKVNPTRSEIKDIILNTFKYTVNVNANESLSQVIL